jgi:hypothetical protein
MVAESKLPNELDRYIAATSAADRMAELSTHVDVERWTSYLETMPIPVKILMR